MNLFVIIASFLAGALSGMGLGGGGILLVFLTAFSSIDQLAAQGINLIFFLPTGLIAVIVYAIKKQIEWRIVLKMWLYGIIGAFGGYFIARAIETEYLSKVFAIFLMIFGIIMLFSKEKRKKAE